MSIKFANNAASLLAGSLSNSATSVSVTAGDGLKFPTLGAGDYFYATLVKLVSGAPVSEIVKVTAKSTDTLTIVRGQEGTTATTFAAGDRIEIRVTQAGMDAKANLEGATFTGDVGMPDKVLSGPILKDTSIAYNNSGTGNTLDYTTGQHQRWSPNTGAQTLTITNWPPSGQRGELLIEGVNLGAATITSPSINWIKSDGTFTTTTSMNTNQGATLQTAGTDFILLWTRDGGTTIYGKVVR